MDLLTDLASRAEIANALAELARAQDRHDWDAVAGSYLPDATYTHPGGTLEGAAAITDRTRRALQHLDSSQHLVGTIVIEVTGDTASTFAQFHALHVRRGTPGGEDYVIAGSYEDRWVRTPDGWRIAHRKQEYHWRSGNRDVVVPPESEGENA